MSDLIFKTIEKSDIPEVLDLFQRVFGRELSLDYYNWQYFDCVFGGGYSKGAWLGGQLVSHIGYTPRRFLINGEAAMVLSNHTVMNDSKQRGKGIYSQLVTWALNEHSQEGFKLVLSHPNGFSHPVQAMQKEYVDMAFLPALTWRGGKVNQPSNDANPSEHFKICDSFPTEYEDLCEYTPGGKLYAVLRSPDYFSWRYSCHPASVYYIHENRQSGKLLSAVFFKYYTKDNHQRINIVEWLCSDQDRVSAEKPLKEILEFADRFGLDVQIWHSIYDRVRYNWLERLGFAPETPIFYFGVYPLQSTQQLGPFTDFRNWYKTMGDHDVF